MKCKVSSSAAEILKYVPRVRFARLMFYFCSSQQEKSLLKDENTNLKTQLKDAQRRMEALRTELRKYVMDNETVGKGS